MSLKIKMAAVTRAADVSDTLLAKTYLYFGPVAVHATPISKASLYESLLYEMLL